VAVRSFDRLQARRLVGLQRQQVRSRKPEQGHPSGLAEGGLGRLPRWLGAANDVREAGLLSDGRDPGMADEFSYDGRC
jgi:hypothetical protein